MAYVNAARGEPYRKGTDRFDRPVCSNLCWLVPLQLGSLPFACEKLNLLLKRCW